MPFAALDVRQDLAEKIVGGHRAPVSVETGAAAQRLQHLLRYRLGGGRVRGGSYEFIDPRAEVVAAEGTLQEVLGAVSERVFFGIVALISGHQNQKRGDPQPCPGAKLGDGILDPEVGEDRGNDHDGRFEMRAAVDRVVHVACNFEPEVPIQERRPHVLQISRLVFDHKDVRAHETALASSLRL